MRIAPALRTWRGNWGLHAASPLTGSPRVLRAAVVTSPRWFWGAAGAAGLPGPLLARHESVGVKERPSIFNVEVEQLTPAMKQYRKIKLEHPEYLVMFRMGDFYEMFFEDAVASAHTLGITLTARGRARGLDVPMSGIPFHALDKYLRVLVKHGHRVAICEQVEGPQAGRNTVMQREVVRLVTPGTLTEDVDLSPVEPNYLAAIYMEVSDHIKQSALAVSWIDISTGSFGLLSTTLPDLSTELSRISPREILVAEGLAYSGHQPEPVEGLRECLREFDITEVPLATFAHGDGVKRMKALFETGDSAILGAHAKGEVCASAALFSYVEKTQRGKLPRVTPPHHGEAGQSMYISAGARRSLELTRALTHAGGRERAGSLLHAIDRTLTAAGGRELLSRLSSPLTDCGEIHNRLDWVQFYVDNPDTCQAVRQALRGVRDMERCLQRLSFKRGGPRDLAAIGASLDDCREVLDGLWAAAGRSSLLELPMSLEKLTGHYGYDEESSGPRPLLPLLEAALMDDPPISAADGGFVKRGFNDQLDELLRLRDHGRSAVKEMTEALVDSTGVGRLKIKRTDRDGMFMEVPLGDRATMDAIDGFVMWSSTSTVARYKTRELTDLHMRLVSAAEEVKAFERAVFNELADAVLLNAQSIVRLAHGVAAIDVCAGLAVAAGDGQYCRPEVLAPGEGPAVLEVRGGRHPVIEAAQVEESFTPNDCVLGKDEHLWLITGPNMGGKSTFLRQNALIAILAQIGSFVPADTAVLTVVDRLFTRIGSSDELAQNRSTFMVEMVETAEILRSATEQSMIILDEVGRGTSTRDGLSIASAILEYIHEDVRARTLFATHFHELGQVAQGMDAVGQYHVLVDAEGDNIVFTHHVERGVALQSYGIHCAELAGLPAKVIESSTRYLNGAERGP